MSTQKQLRIIAFLEGMSYLILLFIAMPLKYIFDTPEAVSAVGMAHGILFIAYFIWIFIVGPSKNWTMSEYALAAVASIIPFGTFYADNKVFQKP